MEDYRKIAIELGQTLISKAPETRKDVERMMPELKESEDERIRKQLIEHTKWSYDEQEISEEEKERWISWIEKQAEHKKFRDSIQVGDKVTRNEDGVLVNLSQLSRVAKKDEKQGEQKPTDKVEPKFKIGDFIVNDYCMGRIVEITNDAYLLDTEQGIPFSCHSTRLWDVTKDANDGDVLVCKSGERPFIFKGLLDSFHPKCPVAYCGICADDSFQVSSGNGWWTALEVFPATKEQRNTLTKAMADAGYTFDFEKKKLKKIEQPKQEWSEEDEIWFKELELMALSFSNDDSYRKKFFNWLKSLKDRVQPQNRWKPSDEQIRVLNDVINHVAESEKPHWNDYIYNTLKDVREQLKKLREK